MVGRGLALPVALGVAVDTPGADAGGRRLLELGALGPRPVIAGALHGLGLGLRETELGGAQEVAQAGQPLAMVVAGHGTARQGSGSSDIGYLCLIAPSGEPVFVDVTVASGATILAECNQPATGTSRLACLSDLLRTAELGLAEAEAKAVQRARSDGPRTQRAELEEPAATSIGAWRVYRDAECDRQREASSDHSTDLYQACRVGLTRDRVRQLGL